MSYANSSERSIDEYKKAELHARALKNSLKICCPATRCYWGTEGKYMMVLYSRISRDAPIIVRLRRIAGMFDYLNCRPAIARYSFNKIQCYEWKNRSKIYDRELESPAFCQALGWAVKPHYFKTGGAYKRVA